MLKLFILLLSFNALADQSEILLQGRHQFIKDAQKILKNYCEEGETYRCLIQMKADCSHGDEARKKYGCETLGRVEALEKRILAVDKSLKEMPTEEPVEPIVKTLPPVVLPPAVKVAEVFKQLNVMPGSSVTKEGAEDFKVLKDLQDKINSQKIRMDCSDASDCALQDFGQWGCGGPNGTFVYSIKTNFTSLKSDIEQFTKLDKDYLAKWNRDLIYTCALKNRTEPAACESNQCR
jgi:hypothetical protein